MSGPPRPAGAPAAARAGKVTLAAMLIAAAAAILFSSKSIFIKLAYAVPGLPGAAPVDAVTLLSLRMLFALPFFLAVGAWAGGRKKSQPVSGRDRLAILGLGFLGYYLSSYLDFIGLKYISASLERLILYLYPTFTVLLSALLYRRTITRRMVVALAVCYAGVGLVFSHDLLGASLRGEVWTGGAFVAASAMTYALYLVTGTEVIARVGATRFTAYAMTVSSIICIAQFLVLNPLSHLDLPIEVYGYGALLATVSTVLPSFLTAAALKQLGANNVALFGAVGPISTIALGALILGERINAWQIAGALLVIAGVLTITIRPTATPD